MRRAVPFLVLLLALLVEHARVSRLESRYDEQEARTEGALGVLARVAEDDVRVRRESVAAVRSVGR